MSQEEQRLAQQQKPAGGAAGGYAQRRSSLGDTPEPSSLFANFGGSVSRASDDRATILQQLKEADLTQKACWWILVKLVYNDFPP
jgi:hypothetical protein